jgi:FKBP-type peptidyl-prolyl cis-trans isomerase FkpA
MKNIFLVLLCIATISTFAQPENSSQHLPDLKNSNDSLNYFLGLNLGFSLGTAPWEPDAGLITEALTSVLEGKSQYDQQTSQEIFQQLNMALSKEREEIANAEGEANLEKGLAFLTENEKRGEVITTASGLQYEVITRGEGPMPADSSTVEVHYEGTLLDGTVFDSSYERGESISFPLNRVIAGWTEGVQLMSVGSTYRFYIPSELAYGPRAAGPIPANSVLIFKIELLGIE